MHRGLALVALVVLAGTASGPAAAVGSSGATERAHEPGLADTAPSVQDRPLTTGTATGPSTTAGATTARDSGLIGPVVIGVGLAVIVGLAVVARWRRTEN